MQNTFCGSERNGSLARKKKMYRWRIFIAIILGLVWYLSDCGVPLAIDFMTVTQYFLCFLFYFSTPLLFGNTGRESSTQTDEEEHPLQETTETLLFGDSTDGGIRQQSNYPHVKRSLQQVFECAYAQLVLPWYNVPEPIVVQPLHQVLSRELNFVINQIIERAKDFDVCQVVVGSIRILTQHLHNAKQPDRELLFSSRAAEIAVLREFSEALVRNLFAESLWGQGVNRSALNEIIALKALGPLVSWLSDPDNLNQLVVSQLDSVTPKGSVEELSGSDQEQASSQEGEGSEASLEEAEGSTSKRTKSKRNKLKEGWSKFVDKMKSKKAKKKKMKKMEQELMMTFMQCASCTNEDVSNMEGSIHSQHDSDREDSDLDDYLKSVQEDMLEFKLSYEMWRVGCWAVSIPHADWDNEDLIFTVHLEEKDSPENLHWNIRKTYMDVIFFRNRWQDSPSLPQLVALEHKEQSDKVKEEVRASVEHFLQELVSDNTIGHTQPVFLFLCPLDKLLNEDEHYGGVWSILSGLAYFLTPGQEEEENVSPHTEGPKENRTPSALPKSAAVPSEKPDLSSSALPTIVISECEPYVAPQEERQSSKEIQDVGRSGSSPEIYPQDKNEDPGNSSTSHFKMIIKGLSRSRSEETLVSSKTSYDEDQLGSGCSQSSLNGSLRGDCVDGPSRLYSGTRSNKKDKIGFRMLNGPNKAKGKDNITLPRGEDAQKSQGNWEQLEATKAIFDLLKEISVYETCSSH
ncbi:uncharacterized protein si:rp71-46j2.7 isoform X2 [Thalassophryne amazonica]|uniref:uncharacterized protein si:rp71-46j2.7 isoform X2 n=1 Tax=Thalassophryne amazonica TaxID=390379 RepID=UPI001471B340|nr:uncharacterized protein si:rp71-46j2.7 isoform X2 [Thalassophryne amazonica]